MSNLHMMKNPWAVVKTTVQCQHCSNVYSAQKINCFDIRLWPEGREVLDQGEFFHPVCPQCGAQAEISYPSRYIDKELGIAAVLTPGIENQDTGELLTRMNRNLEGLASGGMEHRAVGNFYAMAEQLRIHRHNLNDKAVQLLKPLIIGNLQSQGFEVWNGFFMGVLHPEGAEQLESTMYVSTQQNEDTVYTEDVYQFDIYLTNGDIIPQGINDTAYQIVMNILKSKGLEEDDGEFHLYDLSWAIDVHNSMRQN